MKHIISLSYSGHGDNSDQHIEFNGHNIRVSHFNINFNYKLGLSIIKEYDGLVDAFCISGIAPQINDKDLSFIHPQVQGLFRAAKVSPVCDGAILKRVYLPYVLREYLLRNPKTFNNRSVSLYSGAFHYNLLDDLVQFGAKLYMGDPFFFFGFSKVLRSKSALKKFIKFSIPIFRHMKIKRSGLGTFSKNNKSKYLDKFFQSDLFVANESTFSLIDLNHLKGKNVLIDFLSPSLKKRFTDIGVHSVITCAPEIEGLEKMNFPCLHAILQVSKGVNGLLNDDDIINFMQGPLTGVQYLELQKSDIFQNDTKFAFIIHPLSSSHIFKHPKLKKVEPFITKKVSNIVEGAVSLFPGFFYGKMKGICSENNKKNVEGLIYTVTETPKKLLEKDVNVIYSRLIELCEQAHNEGAKIIGLGAYTKIVGDAGVSVNERSPIPVTTGNSLSACATLWAAKFALDKMELVPKLDNRYQGTVMIVGATGSIGAVSAKVLATSWKKIILVAPRAYKIMELKKEIEQIDKVVEVLVTTNPDSMTHESDLIITSTSAQGKRILDISHVKPGAVICDVSRPFDISEEDALRRPDIMVIASGEVKLPGNLKGSVDLGLEGDIVYACLAETALLAMEGKFESFTLSRNIDYHKVLEIDRLAGIHGVRLSCIMGHNGFISDSDFKLCKELALNRLASKNSP